MVLRLECESRLKVEGSAWQLNPKSTPPLVVHADGKAALAANGRAGLVSLDAGSSFTIHSPARQLVVHAASGQESLAITGDNEVQLQTDWLLRLTIGGSLVAGSTVRAESLEIKGAVGGAEILVDELKLGSGASNSQVYAMGDVLVGEEQLARTTTEARVRGSSDLVGCRLDIDGSLGANRIVDCEGRIEGALDAAELSWGGRADSPAGYMQLQAGAIDVSTAKGTGARVVAEVISIDTAAGQLDVEAGLSLHGGALEMRSLKGGSVSVDELTSSTIAVAGMVATSKLKARRTRIEGSLECPEVDSEHLAIHFSQGGKSSVDGTSCSLLQVGPPQTDGQGVAELVVGPDISIGAIDFLGETILRYSKRRDQPTSISMRPGAGPLRLTGSAHGGKFRLVAVAPSDNSKAALNLRAEGIVELDIGSEVTQWDDCTIDDLNGSSIEIRATSRTTIAGLKIGQGQVRFSGPIEATSVHLGEGPVTTHGDESGSLPRFEVPTISLSADATAADVSGSFRIGELAGRAFSAADNPARVLGVDSVGSGNRGQLDGFDLTQISYHEIDALESIGIVRPDPKSIVRYASEIPLESWAIRERAARIARLADALLAKPQDGDSRSRILWAQARLQHRISVNRLEATLRSAHRLLGYGYRPWPPLLTYISVAVCVASMAHLPSCTPSGASTDGLNVCARGYGNGIWHGLADSGRILLQVAFYPFRLVSGDNPLGHLPVATQAPVGVLLLGLPFTFSLLAARNFLRARPTDHASTP